MLKNKSEKMKKTSKKYLKEFIEKQEEFNQSILERVKKLEETTSVHTEVIFYNHSKRENRYSIS